VNDLEPDTVSFRNVQDELALGARFGLGPALPMEDDGPDDRALAGTDHCPPNLHGLSRDTQQSTSEEDGNRSFIHAEKSFFV
jgi:hypothetical protein